MRFVNQADAVLARDCNCNHLAEHRMQKAAATIIKALAPDAAPLKRSLAFANVLQLGGRNGSHRELEGSSKFNYFKIEGIWGFEGMGGIDEPLGSCCRL